MGLCHITSLGWGYIQVLVYVVSHCMEITFSSLLAFLFPLVLVRLFWDGRTKLCMCKTEVPHGLAQELEVFLFCSFQMNQKVSERAPWLSAALCEGRAEEVAQKHIGNEEHLSESGAVIWKLSLSQLVANFPDDAWVALVYLKNLRWFIA